MTARKRTNSPTPHAQERVALDDVHQLIRQTKARDPLPVFKQELAQNECLHDWNALVDAGCSERTLLDLVIGVRTAFAHHQRLQSEPARMDSKRLRSLVRKTRSVARQWRQEFQSPFGKEVLRWAEVRDPSARKGEFVNLPRRLLSLADWAEDIHSNTEHQRRPLYDDALAELTESVKQETGDYHDREVSVLVAFATQQDCYDENTLRVWRSQHPRSLIRASSRLFQH